MKGEALVIKALNDKAKVKVQKQSACSHNCSECEFCHNPSYEVMVLNPIGAKEGDKVIIEASTKKVLLVSFFMYILPVFMLIISAIVTDICKTKTFYSVLIFAFVFLIWFILIKLTNKYAKIKNVIVEVIDKGDLT